MYWVGVYVPTSFSDGHYSFQLNEHTNEASVSADTYMRRTLPEIGLLVTREVMIFPVPGCIKKGAY